MVYKNWEKVLGLFKSVGKAFGAVKDFLFGGADVPEAERARADSPFLRNVNTANLATANRSGAGQNVNVSIDSKIEVPAGTPADQEQFVKQVARNAIRSEVDGILRGANSNVSFAGA